MFVIAGKLFQLKIGGAMDRWRVVTEKRRDDDTGKWEVKFFAVAPNGKMIPCASHAGAQQYCKDMHASIKL